ncbi:MAG: pentapeptide repeat-containing protein [Cyanobacteria bacterium J06621_11]
MNHLTLLQQGIESWNQWRDRHPNAVCDLEGQDLSHGYFFEGNFSGANLKNANLQRACLVGVNFKGADLSGADLSGAYLADANFYGANLSHANLSKTDLDRADIREANLLGTQLAEVDLRHTKLPDPTVNPYSHQVAALLAKTSTPSTAPKSDKKLETTSNAKAAPIRKEAGTNKINAKKSASTPSKLAQPNPIKWQPSQWFRAASAVKIFSRENPEAIADYQQRIRLSAIPASTKNNAPLTNRLLTKAAPTAQKSPSESTTAPVLKAPAKTSPKTSSKTSQWGRRQVDQTLSAQLARLLTPRTAWAPTTVAATGLVLAISWPTLTGNLPNVKLGNEGTSQTVITAEATSLALVKSLTGESQIWSIATQSLANGTTQVLAGKANGDIQIWDGKTGETIRTLSGHSDGVKSLAISKSGQWLVSSDRTALKVWNPTSGELIHTIPVAESAAGDGVTEGAIATVAIAPDDTTFISSTQSGIITAWDMASGTKRYSLENNSEVWSVAIAPNSQSFVSGNSDRTIRQWDIATGTLLKEFTGHTDSVRSVAISPDGQTLASGSWDQTIKLWDIATGDLQTTLSGHTDQIFSLAISPDGQTLASSSTDRTVKLWDLPNQALAKTLDNDTESVVTVAFATNSPNNLSATSAITPILISGGQAQTVNIWQ